MKIDMFIRLRLDWISRINCSVSVASPKVVSLAFLFLIDKIKLKRDFIYFLFNANPKIIVFREPRGRLLEYFAVALPSTIQVGSVWLLSWLPSSLTGDSTSQRVFSLYYLVPFGPFSMGLNCFLYRNYLSHPRGHCISVFHCTFAASFRYEF